MRKRKGTWTENYLGQLVGAKVLRVVKDQDTYGLEFSSGLVAWIMCDPEGNGPGHLHIQGDSLEEQIMEQLGM